MAYGAAVNGTRVPWAASIMSRPMSNF